MNFPRLPLRWPRPAALSGLLLAALPLVTVLWVHTAAAAPQPPNLAAAIAAQREKVANSPGSAEAHNDLGNLLALGQDRPAAEEAYREALRLDPDSFSARFNLAVLLRSGHRPGEALEVLERAIALQPDSAWAHYQRGAAHQDLGRRKRATKDYARAFALDNRLALPDVNPLVIGNPLVTAAMLTRQDVPVADSTPRSYADPVAIGQLLQPLPPPTQPTAAPATAGGKTAQPPAATAVGAVRPSASATAPPSPEDRAGARAGDRARPPGAPEIARPEPDDRRITTDDLRSLRILNQAPPESGEQPPEGGTREGTGVEAPQRFRPGRRSSAQLDLQLLPGAGPTQALAPAVTLSRR